MYDITRADDISILHLYGEISLLEMEMLEKTLRSFKKRNFRKILLDLAGVDHMHFEVARRLADQANKLRAENGGLKIACSNEETKAVIRFTGADQFLEDYSTVSEAILSFLRHNGCEGPWSYLDGGAGPRSLKTKRQKLADDDMLT